MTASTRRTRKPTPPPPDMSLIDTQTESCDPDLPVVIEDAPNPPAEPAEPTDDRSWQDFLSCSPSVVDLPLDEGEEITGQRTDDDFVTWVTTNAGRKIGLSPDGWMSVVVGPDLDVTQPPVPQPKGHAKWQDLYRD